MSAHETSVWNRIAEGSQQAECTCGWKGPKRTAIAGLAYTDADQHTESALQRTTPNSKSTPSDANSLEFSRAVLRPPTPEGGAGE